VVPIIDDVVNWCRTTIGITSFSITSTDHQLWEEYGGKGNWVLVEINIPDSLVSQSYHLVHYVSDKIFHVDSLLETALFPSKTYETYRNILLTKKKKLSQDEEMRFIGNRQDVNLIFDCSITEITFGPSFPAYSLEQLVTHIANHCTANNIKITKL
jgi:hypothetical protein